MPLPFALSAGDLAGLGLLVALAALIVAAAVRLLRRPSRPPQEAPVPSEEIERELEREAGASALPESLPPPPAAAAVEAPVADLEEARKKEEYRRKKEAERAEKERRRLEREEEARRAREEAERLAHEAETARLREEEERRLREEAEGGRTLAAGLEKTRGGFVARLQGLFGGRGGAVDEHTLAELEEILFTADIGVKTATALLENARERVRRRELDDPEKLKGALREEIARIVSLRPAQATGGDLGMGEARPFVIMVVGVNGSGKTTTVGKLAAQLRQGGHRVLLGAGDTFRAAAGEQLEIWAERVGAPVVRGKDAADPASVCFEAVRRGVEEKFDVVLLDTAGRLHTKLPLMEELKKVKRVLDKALPGAPHLVLLVLDATNGQNAIAQARQFHEALGVGGIVLTKLDGTAKGGVIIGICDELRIPVRYVGVGEKVADLRQFEPREFVDALFD
ncbi:MAG TPA: signal recognition particle-docking protein FtsY [Anaeromyxobacteraceae bacterium]|nr:signal recognition particle-docking protein FtsY [Anaeromyxobacteraceae bacterium]